MTTDKGFLRFVGAINDHDVEVLSALMADDHVFVDGLGNRTAGAETMKAGWAGYFAMCSDYWIRADDVASRDELVLAVGEAGGTIAGTSWRTPAAWKCIVHAGKIMEWRVFADNKPVYEILAMRQR